jgi:hypothetical protein
MADSYKQKVEECWEIRDKGVFDQKSVRFLKDMRAQLRIMDEDTLTGPQKDYIDSLHDQACRSPY